MAPNRDLDGRMLNSEPEHPSLTPLTASELLRNNTTAQNRLLAIKRQDRTCEYKLDVPADQAGARGLGSD